jgi:hypothetical protein
MANVNLLKESINPLYLLPKNIKAITKEFKTTGYVQLADFLTEKKMATLLKNLKKIKVAKSYEPDLHRYSHGALKKLLFSDATFGALLATLFSCEGHTDFEVFEFGVGDYTLLHDIEHDKEGVLVWLDCTKDWNAEAGGMTVVTSEENDPLLFAPTFNALHAVRITRDLGSFVKYVNCFAGKKKLLLVKGWV